MKLDSIVITRKVLFWRKFSDCWEADLSCGHKMNTGPGSVSEEGGIASLRIKEQCPTCEAIARQVVPPGDL